MGMIKVEMSGSFPDNTFKTSAEEGGHVMAIKRTIEFLAKQLGLAVREDVRLTMGGVVPPKTSLGYDLEAVAKPPVRTKNLGSIA